MTTRPLHPDGRTRSLRTHFIYHAVCAPAYSQDMVWAFIELIIIGNDNAFNASRHLGCARTPYRSLLHFCNNTFSFFLYWLQLRKNSILRGICHQQQWLTSITIVLYVRMLTGNCSFIRAALLNWINYFSFSMLQQLMTASTYLRWKFIFNNESISIGHTLMFVDMAQK